jgi:DNA repair ATPase RecN
VSHGFKKVKTNCQKVGQERKKKLSKSCQKVVKKLSKNGQKIGKKLVKSVKKLLKSCQKVVKKLSKNWHRTRMSAIYSGCNIVVFDVRFDGVLMSKTCTNVRKETTQ